MIITEITEFAAGSRAKTKKLVQLIGDRLIALAELRL
jgi:hypothetical protein